MISPLKKIFTEEVANGYEPINHILTAGLDGAWRWKAARVAAGGGGLRWLDVCSGTGEMADALRSLAGEGTTVVAADFSRPMLGRAAGKKRRGAIFFTLADAASLPFGDASFDLVTISFGARNLGVRRDLLGDALKELHRILRPGGRFVNVETSQPPSRLVRWLFHRYVQLFVRPVGQAISGSRAGYSYLSSSIPRFYGAEELAGIIRAAGFSSVTFQRMMLGAAAVHKAIK